MRYISWISPLERDAPPESKHTMLFFGMLGGVLRMVLPQANADYDHKISTVGHWWIELDDDGIPQREIGFDCDDVPIMAMPEGRNYGYITDSNVTFEHHENDAAVEAMFEGQWHRALTHVKKNSL